MRWNLPPHTYSKTYARAPHTHAYTHAQYGEHQTGDHKVWGHTLTHTHAQNGEHQTGDHKVGGHTSVEVRWDQTLDDAQGYSQVRHHRGRGGDGDDRLLMRSAEDSEVNPETKIFDLANNLNAWLLSCDDTGKTGS